MRNSLTALLVVTLFASPLAQLSWSTPASAQVLVQSDSDGENDSEALQEEAERLARETAERLMETLRMMLEFIPQYEMPEINENGDIIIRRKRKAPEPGDVPGDGDTSKT
jgi:hypothetical protein